jgi:tetratricopeptide (TPR) repeat protein/predicted Ser/Thr protein kinase
VGNPEAGADPVLDPGTRVGDFQILRLLGEGGMGQIYLAEDTTLGRRVALKLIKRWVLQHHGAARFLEEARATASFNHPHIVTLYAVGEHDGRPYLALEYIDGESLRARLAAGPLPMREAVRCCHAVAEAIAEAHRRGLVHADLKPENVVVSSDGRVRVVDFGLARIALGDTTAASGTPAYMAPERWRGAPPTGAIDVWALGVMLHELIAGHRPFADDALLHLAFAGDTLELPDLPATPWAQLVRDCLAIDPAGRPPAEELVRRLAGLLELPAATTAADALATWNLAWPNRPQTTELATNEARLVREVLLALVARDGTRRRLRRSELLAGVPTGSRNSIDRLLDRLVDRHLLVAATDLERDDATVEVAQEALATAWPQLARWFGEADAHPRRLMFWARNAGPPGDDWLIPVVERMVCQIFRDREDRKFEVDHAHGATPIELEFTRGDDRFRIAARSRTDERVLAFASAMSVAGAARELAGTLETKLGRGLEPLEPEPAELEEMRRIGARSVQVFRRYRNVTRAYFATMMPDSHSLAAMARDLVAGDPEWAHPYALLAYLEGLTTEAGRNARAAGRATASTARDPSGADLLRALDLVANGDSEAAFHVADDVFRGNDADLLAGSVLLMTAWLLQHMEEAAAVTRRRHALHPDLGFGQDLAALLRVEARDTDADRVIREWATAAPENVVARVELARIEASSGRHDEARARAREAVVIHRERDEALPDLFEALMEAEQVSDARMIAEQMLVGSPLNRARGRYRIAVTSLFQGRFAAAYDAVRRAIAEHRAFGFQSQLTQCLELARALAPLVADQDAQRRHTAELAAVFANLIGDAGAASAMRFELALLDHPVPPPSIDEHLSGLKDGPVRDGARRRMLRAAALADCGPPHKAVAAGFSTLEENTASLVAFGLCAWRMHELTLARRSLERATRLWSSVGYNQSSAYHAILARFHLAGVLGELGEHAAACAAYEAFLRCWSDPDRPIPEVAIARKMLASGSAAGC